MAIVKDYMDGNTHVTIHDDAYSNCSEEEIKEREERIKRTFQRLAEKKREKPA